MKIHIALSITFLLLFTLISSSVFGQLQVLDAKDDFETIDEDSVISFPLYFDVLANDLGDQTTRLIAEVSEPAHGIAYIVDTVYIGYTPIQNYCGSDHFTYTMTDASGETDTATVTIAITCVNDSPIAKDYFISVIDDQAATEINIDATVDVDDDELEVTIITSPEQGTATGKTNTITYRPTSDSTYCGNDNFTYTITDSQGLSDEGTVNVTIYCAPIPPEVSCGSQPPLSTVGNAAKEAINDYSLPYHPLYSQLTWCNDFQSVDQSLNGGKIWDSNDWILDVPNVVTNTVETSADDFYSMIGDMIENTQYVFSMSTLGLTDKVPLTNTLIIEKYLAPSIALLNGQIAEDAPRPLLRFALAKDYPEDLETVYNALTSEINALPEEEQRVSIAVGTIGNQFVLSLRPWVHSKIAVRDYEQAIVGGMNVASGYSMSLS